MHATIRGRGRVKISNRSKIWEPDENYSLFSKTIILRKSDNDDFFVLPAGKYTYNISHELPKEIPSSFSGKYGFVVYQVSITLHENAYTLDSIFSQAFLIFNNNRILIPNPPEKFQETTTICGCCCLLQDKLKMDITPLSNNCTAGDVVKFEATFENESYEKINEMRLKVYKNIEYIWPKDPSMKKEQKIIIQEKKEQGVDFSHDELCVFSVKIPFTQPTMQNQWINITYLISVETFLPTCCDDEIRVQCPITIGIGNIGPEFQRATSVVTAQPTLSVNPVLSGYKQPQITGYQAPNVGWNPQQNITPYPPTNQQVVVPGWSVSQTTVQTPYPIAATVPFPTSSVPNPIEATISTPYPIPAINNERRPIPATSTVPYPMPATDNAPYLREAQNIPQNNNTQTSINVQPISNATTQSQLDSTTPYPSQVPVSNTIITPISSQLDTNRNYNAVNSYKHYTSDVQSTPGISTSSDLFKSQHEPGYPPTTSYASHSGNNQSTYDSTSHYKIPSESYQSSISAVIASDAYLSQKSPSKTNTLKTTLQTSYKPIESLTESASLLNVTKYKTPSESFQSSISAVTASDSYLSHLNFYSRDPYATNTDLTIKPSINTTNEINSLLNTEPKAYTFSSDSYQHTDFSSYPSASNPGSSQENRDNLKININPDFSRSASYETTPSSPYDPVLPEFGETTNTEYNTPSNVAGKSGRNKITAGRKKLNERNKK